MPGVGRGRRWFGGRALMTRVIRYDSVESQESAGRSGDWISFGAWSGWSSSASW